MAEQDPQNEPKRDRRGHIHRGGMPAGKVTAKTQSKEDAREAARAIIAAELEPILRALIEKAKGTRFLVYRDENGKFIKVTERQAAKMKATNYERLEVWDRPADVFAAQELLNRYLDKARQPVDAHLSGKLTLEQLVAGALSPDDESSKSPAK